MRPDTTLRPLGTLVFATVVAASCVGINDEHAVTVWEAELVPAMAHPGFTGQAAAVSRLDGTSIGIGIDGAAPGAEHAWGLRLGTCAAPGAQIGPDDTYPTLVADLIGVAEAETSIGPRLSLDESYHVEVRESLTDPSRVACGDLVGR